MAFRRASFPVTLATAISLNGVWEPVPAKRRAALARFASSSENVLFPTPDEAASLFASGTVSELVVLWRAGLKTGPDAQGLSAPFSPPGGKPRLAFRLLSVAPAPEGFGSAVVARYGVKN